MLKTLTLALCTFVTTSLPAFAHTGEAIRHDLLHTVMNHDGSVTVGVILAFGIGVVGLTALRRRSRS